MNKVWTVFNTYALHDCMVNRVSFKEKQIVFFFPDGIYRLNAEGKADYLIPAGCVAITVKDTGEDSENIFVSEIVYRNPYHRKGRYQVKKEIHEVSKERFRKKVYQHGFCINDVYYSAFSRTMLILGQCGNGEELSVEIADVVDVLIHFNTP